MSRAKKLRDLPANDIETATGFDCRHEVGSRPEDYLNQFLIVARQYGYATRDDSWGELEKELKIAFRTLERQRRFIDSLIYQAIEDGDARDYDEIYDEVIDKGETFWNEIQKMKKYAEMFG